MQTRDILIGAGIAGACVARALVARGRGVVVVDGDGVAGGASGVPRAVVQPVTGMRASWRPRYAEARDRAEALLRDHVSRDLHVRRGVLRIALDERHATLWSRQMDAAPDDVARWVDGHEARAIADGISAGTTGGIHLPGGLDLDGPGVVRSLLDAPGITVRRARVRAVETVDGAPGVWLDDGTWMAGRSVVVAAGVGAAALLPGLGVTLTPVRGVCGWRETAIASRVVVGHRGQIVPMGDRTFVGSTFSPGDDARRIDLADLDLLAERLGQAIPGAYGPVVDGWAGVRVAARDRNPVVAQVPDQPGVFAVAALGSKGFLLAPWIADRVAAAIADGSPIEVPDAWGWR